MHEPLSEYFRKELYAEAEAFISTCYAELGRESEIDDRLDEIEAEIEHRGHYDHTSSELEHGEKMA